MKREWPLWVYCLLFLIGGMLIGGGCEKRRLDRLPLPCQYTVIDADSVIDCQGKRVKFDHKKNWTMKTKLIYKFKTLAGTTDTVEAESLGDAEKACKLNYHFYLFSITKVNA